ncbi:MAG: hypothetical protein MUF54_16030, partial [Polyangiaceae bacterium]|nr:hypothetical protein [Polyangiaceae bacterium]
MTRFIDASLAGAHVLHRLKSRASPVVTAWYDQTGKRHELESQDARTVRLQQACEFLLPATGQLDLDVMVTDSQKRTCVARIVCVPFEGEDRYYLTSLPREIFTPSDCAELVRVRWEVELFF